jgi:hypothetical protein
LRRWLPPGKRPWREKPRWKKEEIAALESGMSPGQRNAAAARKFLQRRREDAPEEGDRTVLTVKQVAADLGISRAKVYRLLRLHYLRRFEGGIAEIIVPSIAAAASRGRAVRDVATRTSRVVGHQWLSRCEFRGKEA